MEFGDWVDIWRELKVFATGVIAYLPTSGDLCFVCGPVKIGSGSILLESHKVAHVGPHSSRVLQMIGRLRRGADGKSIKIRL
jgi:hypothetical protein